MTLCGAMFFCFAGCDKSEAPVPSEITVSDGGQSTPPNFFPAKSCGVRLEKAVEKAVSLSPAATEIICELGFGDKLAGISDYCDFPENLSAARVGSTENPDIDTIIKLKPDVVFTLSPISERETYTLNKANILVLAPEPPKNLEGYSALYREIAAAFYGKETTGSEKQTQKAVEIGANARSELEKAAKSVSLESYVYVTAKLTIAGADTFESAVLSLAGKNLCAEDGYASPDTVTETPKYIIADNSLDESDLATDEMLSDFVNDGAKVIFVNNSHFERPAARTKELFSELSSAH